MSNRSKTNNIFLFINSPHDVKVPTKNQCLRGQGLEYTKNDVKTKETRKEKDKGNEREKK